MDDYLLIDQSQAERLPRHHRLCAGSPAGDKGGGVQAMDFVPTAMKQGPFRIQRHVLVMGTVALPSKGLSIVEI